MTLIKFLLIILSATIILNNNIFSRTGELDGSGGGIIAFISDRDGTKEIYLMNADGSYQTQVTHNNALNLGLDWSHDGTHLAFCSNIDGNFEIYVMDVVDITKASFTEPDRITNNTVMDFGPTWSPDGNRLVYEGTVSGVDQICVIDTNGTNYRQLTSIGVNTGPAWYPISEPVSVTQSENIPSEFRLFQNYPNPFNPVTKISYQISGPCFVTIKVFDVSGNTIAILVNEEKQAGEYAVQLDACLLSSGIYFYKLQVNNFTETRKMILIR